MLDTAIRIIFFTFMAFFTASVVSGRFRKLAQKIFNSVWGRIGSDLESLGLFFGIMVVETIMLGLGLFLLLPRLQTIVDAWIGQDVSFWAAAWSDYVSNFSAYSIIIMLFLVWSLFRTFRYRTEKRERDETRDTLKGIKEILHRMDKRLERLDNRTQKIGKRLKAKNEPS